MARVRIACSARANAVHNVCDARHVSRAWCDGRVMFYWRRLDAPLQASDNAQKHTRVGTCAWMAPEILLHKPYDEKVDIWSYGVTCWEALTGNFRTRTTLRQPTLSHHARRHTRARTAHATPHARRSSKQQAGPMRRCSQPHVKSHRPSTPVYTLAYAAVRSHAAGLTPYDGYENNQARLPHRPHAMGRGKGRSCRRSSSGCGEGACCCPSPSSAIRCALAEFKMQHKTA